MKLVSVLVVSLCCALISCAKADTQAYAGLGSGDAAVAGKGGGNNASDGGNGRAGNSGNGAVVADAGDAAGSGGSDELSDAGKDADTDASPDFGSPDAASPEAGIDDGGSEDGGSELLVELSPSDITLYTGQSHTFSASVTGAANSAVSFSVVEAAGGSISPAGVYTAPGTLGTYHVRATSVADPEQFALATVSTQAPALTYYVSNSLGSDENDGLSPAQAFKTLAKLSTLELLPGTQVLFKADDTFFGQFEVGGSGTSAQPIVISRYGAGENPVLSGSGAEVVDGDFESVIRIENRSYIEIHDLKLTNDRKNVRAGVADNTAYGIHLLNSNGSVLTHFRFINLSFTHILPVASVDFNDNRGNAIAFESLKSDANPEARIDDVLVESCYFTMTGKIAIAGSNGGTVDAANGELGRNSNFIVRNNQSFQTGGSFYVPARVYNVLAEGNNIQYTGSALDPRMANRGSGMWFFSTRHAVAQHNTVLHTYGEGDSYGIHTDYGNKHVLVQYNYTQEAYGGFVEILGANDYVTYRYNVSVNDSLRANGNTFWFSDFAGSVSVPSANIYVYNNSVYINKDSRGDALTPGVNVSEAGSAFVYNNAVMLGGNSSLGVKLYQANANTEFDNNLLFGGGNSTIAPALLAADSHVIEDYALYLSGGLNNAEAYKLRTNSAALERARVVVEPAAILPVAGNGIFAGVTAKAARDYFGNPVDLSVSNQHVGAYNGPALPLSAADDLVSRVSFPAVTCVMSATEPALDSLVGRVALQSPNRRIARYAISAGNTDDTFYIHEWSGEIRNRKPVAGGAAFTLTVSATYVASSDVELQNFVYATRDTTVSIQRP